MSTKFPGAVDDGTSLPDPSTSNNTSSPSHAGLHDTTNAAIKAVESKLGTGASTPAANTILFGTGSGTSAFQSLTSAQLLATVSDETGSGSLVFANTPTLVTPKIDTINESTTSNGVTVGGVNMKSGVVSTSNAIPTAAIAGSAVDYTKVATGFAIQQVSLLSSAVATGTTIIPEDDTIPQNTEGDQYMTLAITPKLTTSILAIHVVFFASSSVTGDIIAALFQDTTANALAANLIYQPTATGHVSVPMIYTMVSGTTSSTTFKIRGGSNQAGTTTFNGQSGNRRFSTIPKSSMFITEYKA